MPENQRSCKRIGLFVVVLFGALWQCFDFYTDLKSVVTYKKACSECSGNGTQSTLLGKVSIYHRSCITLGRMQGYSHIFVLSKYLPLSQDFFFQKNWKCQSIAFS